MKLLQVPAFQFGRQENVVCIWMNLESKIRWSSSSYFMLFMQLCTCYAVFFCQLRVIFFLNYLGIVTNVFSVTLLLAISDFHTHRSVETEKHWTSEVLDLFQHLGDTFSPLIFSLKKKNLQVLFLKSQCLLSRLSRVASRHPMSLSWLRMAEKRCSGVASQSVTSNSHLLE